MVISIVETIMKILIVQVVILFCWHLFMRQGTSLADYMGKLFKGYGKALSITDGVQIIGIVAMFIWLLCIA